MSAKPGIQLGIQIKNLEPLIGRFGMRFIRKFRDVAQTGMDATLRIMHQEVPPYPVKPGEPGSYRRTGTLGRRIGVAQAGGIIGRPDIYVSRASSGRYEARLGTRLHYAKHVIGSRRGQQSNRFRYWWTLPETVRARAEPKIFALWDKIGAKLANFLMGKGR